MIWDRVAPLYPPMHVIFGTYDQWGHEGSGRRARWYWSLRQIAIGFSIITRAEHRDQGYGYEGWHLTLHLGPVTVELHGADRPEEDE